MFQTVKEANPQVSVQFEPYLQINIDQHHLLHSNENNRNKGRDHIVIMHE